GVSLPRPVSERTSITSVRRHRAPLRRYPPSPVRSRRRTIEISLSGRSTVPSELSSTISTSASLRACTPCPPPKITSCMDWPRTASGDCSPIAHSTASVTLDLPEPFGPTTTLTPGPNESSVRWGNDLKPFRVSDFRRTRTGLPPRSHALQPLDCDARGLLLGVLLAPAAPAAQLLSVDPRHHHVGALVRRPLLAGHLVAHLRATPRQQLLERGLEVHGVLESLLDLRRERLHDGLGRALVAGVQVAGADHRLDHRRQHPLGLEQGRGVLAHAFRGRRTQTLRHGEPHSHRAAGDSRDGLCPDLREPPGAKALGLQARIQIGGDRQREHAVSQER